MGNYSTRNPLADGEITGSGTAGQVAVWSSAQVLANPVVNFTSRPTGFVVGSTTEEVSGILTLTSTTQGFIIPRMTTAEANSISSPIAGLMIFSSTADNIRLYTSGGGVPAWSFVVSSAILPVTYAVGDLLYASATNTLSRLADVDAGSFLVSGGLSTAPAWSSSPSIGSSLASPIIYTPSIISSTSAATGISITSTTSGSVTIDNGTTGIIIIGTSLNAKTITIGNSTIGSSLAITGSTGGNSFATNNGSFTVATGTGSVDLGTDAAQHTTTIGSVTGVSATSIRSGTGGLNIGTEAVTKTVTIGNITGTTSVTINTGTGANTWTVTNANWTLATGTGTINWGTDAVEKTINIGTSTGVSVVNFNCGTSGANVGTNAVEHNLTIGNITGTSRIIVNTGTSGSAWTTTNGNWTLNTGTGTININADSTINTINIGTGGAAKTINIGSTSACLIGFFSAAITRFTTGGSASTFVANTSLIVNNTATWDSYTWGQIVKALRNYKILA